jgi:hypothetical protein
VWDNAPEYDEWLSNSGGWESVCYFRDMVLQRAGINTDEDEAEDEDLVEHRGFIGDPYDLSGRESWRASCTCGWEGTKQFIDSYDENSDVVPGDQAHDRAQAELDAHLEEMEN